MKIVLYPDPILLNKAAPVSDFHFVSSVYDEMFRLLQLSNGAGLAAPQVGISQRFFIINITKPMIFINPEIINFSGKLKKETEGCLSLPGVRIDVTRHERVSLFWYDLDGKRRKGTFAGLTSRCIQHEIDHLEGILITSYISL